MIERLTMEFVSTCVDINTVEHALKTYPEEPGAAID